MLLTSLIFILTRQSLYQTPTPPPTSIPSFNSAPVVKNDLSFSLDSLKDSTQSGSFTLSQHGDKTTVTIKLDGSPFNIEENAHIHSGICPNVGEVKYPLKDVVKGQSITTLNVSFEKLVSQLPLALNIHKAGTDISVSCGNISKGS